MSKAKIRAPMKASLGLVTLANSFIRPRLCLKNLALLSTDVIFLDVLEFKEAP
jgi:hypothetical protein